MPEELLIVGRWGIRKKKPISPGERWYTAKEAMEILRISKYTLYDWVKRGILSPDRASVMPGDGRRGWYRFRQADLLRAVGLRFHTVAACEVNAPKRKKK